ncbi:proline-rich protein 5-like [Sycon ciliatum]|uniref:proline-rich protein 5-like n=1 Tax=Sycon ciliatum TaxID=27933 RepID=UPI0031F65489
MELSSPVSVPALQHASSTARLMETQSTRNEDWNTVQRVVLSLFQQKAIGAPGPIDLYGLNQKLLNLMKTEIAPFLGNYYQEQLLKRGMIVMREAVREEIGQSLLDRLAEVWRRFFGSILPSLQAIFYPLTTSQTSSGMSIRNMSLLGFRDIILMKMPVKEALDTEGVVVPPGIKQMLLILSMVREKDHPTETYLRLEDMVAKVVSPFIRSARILKRNNEERASNSPRTDKAQGGSRTLPRNMSSTAAKERSSAPAPEDTDPSLAHVLRGKTFSAHGERGSFPLSAEQQSLRRGQQAVRRKPPSFRSTASLSSDLDTVRESNMAATGDEGNQGGSEQQQQQQDSSTAMGTRGGGGAGAPDTVGSSSSSGEGHLPAPAAMPPSSVQSTGSGESGPDPKTPASVPAVDTPDLGSVDEEAMLEGSVVV